MGPLLGCWLAGWLAGWLDGWLTATLSGVVADSRAMASTAATRKRVGDILRPVGA